MDACVPLGGSGDELRWEMHCGNFLARTVAQDVLDGQLVHIELLVVAQLGQPAGPVLGQHLVSDPSLLDSEALALLLDVDAAA